MPKDWHLVLIVAAMCSGVIIIGIAVAIFGDYKAEIEEDNERPEARNVSLYMCICTSHQGSRSIAKAKLLKFYTLCYQKKSLIIVTIFLWCQILYHFP